MHSICFYFAVKKSPPVTSKLQNYFNSVENPYIEALRLLRNCQDFSNVKSKSLPLFIMEEFATWCSSSLNKAHLLTQQLKLDAFKLISKQNALALIKLVVEAYNMDGEKELFLGVVHCMIEKKQYREVSIMCQIILYCLKKYYWPLSLIRSKL